jgi:antibiotic biosynthesis monooxygenase (ABM) superfamily enzyme
LIPHFLDEAAITAQKKHKRRHDGAGQSRWRDQRVISENVTARHLPQADVSSRLLQPPSKRPGFIEQSVMPPNPPTQVDWVILQRFSSADTAIDWLRSDLRQQLLAEAQHLLVGAHDVHLLGDSAAGVVPAPVSAVITTRLKPGAEGAYRAWEQRIAKAQARSPGFQGYRFEPPMPGVQDDWLAILRFDSERNLQSWLDSPERQVAQCRRSPSLMARTSTNSSATRC